MRKQDRIRTTVGGVFLAAVLVLSGCSRSGTLSGDVAVRTSSGDVTRGARISVFLVVPSDAFEREWADAVAAFQKEVAPAAAAQKAAVHQAEEARLAWDRALAARGKTGARRGQWTLTLRDTSTAGSQQLWRNVRGTEALAFQAKKRVWEIVRRHEEQAHALVEKHTTDRVQTDETGHYVIVKVPVGKVYVYSRLPDKAADFVWFLPIQVEAGTQRADLTHDNQRSWSFIP
jgi:hypothetical protein